MLPPSSPKRYLARRQAIRCLLQGTIGLAALACAVPPAPPTAIPSSAATAPPAPPTAVPSSAATAAPVAPTVSKPTAPTPASKTTDWDRVVAAAKREGQVVMFGPPGSDNRDALVLDLQKRYPEIQVDFTGAQGTPNAAKLLGERSAGLRRVDLFMGPTNVIFQSLLDAGALAPMHEFLSGPEMNPLTQ